jgi:hypothetical protein
VVEQVVRTKDGIPMPADVIKTAATKSGMIVEYMTAYRAITGETHAQTRESIKNYEMTIPYLKALTNSNPGSVKGYRRDHDMKLMELYVVLLSRFHEPGAQLCSSGCVFGCRTLEECAQRDFVHCFSFKRK